MLTEEVKHKHENENDKKVVDDVMDELENLEAKYKSAPVIKYDDEDENKKKKKRHHHRSPDSKRDRKKSR